MSTDMQLPMDELIGRLSDADKRVLKESSDGQYVYPARTIAQETGLPLFVVRKAQRHMHALGVFNYDFLVSEDSSELAGRGYSRTMLGQRVFDALQD